MAYIINNKCIMCDACVPECPENAIIAGDPLYIIDPDLSTALKSAQLKPVNLILNRESAFKQI